MTRRGLLAENSGTLGLILKALDVALIAGLLFAAAEWYDLNGLTPHMVILAFCAVSFYLFFANLFQLYRSWRKSTLWAEFRVLLLCLIAAGTCLLLLGYITKVTSMYSRLTLGTWMLLLPMALLFLRLGLRLLLRHYREKGFNLRRVAIVGSGELAQQLAIEIDESPWMGMQLWGYFDDRRTFREQLPDAPALEIVGTMDDCVAAAYEGTLDEVYVALPLQYANRINGLIHQLSDCTVPVYLVPDVLTFNLMHARPGNIGHVPVISVFESPLDDFGRLVKRGEDVLLSSIILTVIAIPMLLVAIGVKLSSPGPVLFRQRRYGLKGEEIVVWKFRSMTVAEDGDHVPQARKGDARVTRFGAFLRRTSLDELPQFFNVLQGRMSIVGPRPHAVAHNEYYRKNISGYMLRHLMKPGITGWAQVNGWRGETDTPEKMQKRLEHDLEYMKNWSLFFDLRIILLTIVKGFINKNAY